MDINNLIREEQFVVLLFWKNNLYWFYKHYQFVNFSDSKIILLNRNVKAPENYGNKNARYKDGVHVYLTETI